MLAAAALVALPVDTQAQSTWDLTFATGIANPVSDLSGEWDGGLNLGVAGTYWFQDQLGFRLETNVDILPDNGATFGIPLPNLNLWHFGGGLEYSVTDRASDAPSVIVNGGGGLTLMDSDDFTSFPTFVTTDGLSEVYGHLNGGLSVGWPLSDNITIAVNGSIYVVFADEDDIARIPDVTPFDSAVTFPVGVTFRFHL